MRVQSVHGPSGAQRRRQQPWITSSQLYQRRRTENHRRSTDSCSECVCDDDTDALVPKSALKRAVACIVLAEALKHTSVMYSTAYA